MATPLNTLLVLADGPIQSIADLKGRTVGYSVGGFEDALLGAMLERHGLSIDDVTLVNVNFSLSPSILSGQVDAVIGAYRNFELNQMDIEGHPGRAFYIEEEGVPPYDELIVVAHTDRQGNPALRGFVDALERGVQFLINHPDESWQLFLKWPGGARRRAQQARLARHAAALRVTAGGAGHRALRALRGLSPDPGADPRGAARLGLRRGAGLASPRRFASREREDRSGEGLLLSARGHHRGRDLDRDAGRRDSCRLGAVGLVEHETVDQPGVVLGNGGGAWRDAALHHHLRGWPLDRLARR